MLARPLLLGELPCAEHPSALDDHLGPFVDYRLGQWMNDDAWSVRSRLEVFPHERRQRLS